MSETKIQGPVEVELKVHITDGEMSGVATVGMGIGKYPTAEQLRERLQNGSGRRVRPQGGVAANGMGGRRVER